MQSKREIVRKASRRESEMASETPLFPLPATSWDADGRKSGLKLYARENLAFKREPKTTNL